ncbi:MAG: Gmad2 immunoglobulin-like domain-containing protein, partial [Candidatus Paceibacterota bacterium]
PTNENNATTTSDLPIIISYPLEGQEVTSPIKIRGMARGGWYFEASFPIQLNDEAGNIISTAIATALGDWMTTDYVDFTSEMSYPASSTGNATLVFKNDNPSGNPDLDRFELVNVILK